MIYFYFFQQIEDICEKKESSNEKGVEEQDSEGSLEFVMIRRDDVEVCFYFYIHATYVEYFSFIYEKYSEYIQKIF